MAGYGSEGDNDGLPEAGPSSSPKKRPVVLSDMDSGSEFSPEKEGLKLLEDQDKEQDEVVQPVADEDETSDADKRSLPPSNKRRARTTAAPKKAKTKATVSVVIKPSISGPSLSRTSKRQQYILPTPSVHHRHRAVPLYSRAGRVERLASRPSLFRSYDVVMTNNFTHNAKVTERVNKSWGYNVGWGPLWDLVEDRGWYKEAVEGISDTDTEANRRPKVYKDVQVKDGWEILNQTDVLPYLPTDIEITEEGNLKPPPPIQCLFGPIEDQVKITMKMFQAHKMSDFVPGSTGHVFNAGAQAWGLDWCPIHVDDRPGHSYKQYLAVAPFPTNSHSPDVGVRVARPSFACIQIWSLSPTKSLLSSEKDSGEMKCDMVLCVDPGPAHDLKWCPLPSHDDSHITRRPRKLGLMGGTFEDGSWSVYAVPDPRDVTPQGHDPSQPVYVKIPQPLLRIELDETNCWTFDWANSELIAIGTTNGTIAVYDIGPSLKAINNSKANTITNILPTHYITVHQSAIRALTWLRAPPSCPSGAPRTNSDPTVIASGGYDGMECMTDIREGHGSVMNRTRDVINTMSFSPFGGGPITIDHENVVKAYSASPSMLGRGHTLLEPQGPIWTISASDYHPQLAVGSADGACTTTNSLRSTRRGGSVPFFLHKIYQLDYSRNTGVYRMLERFLPQETQERPAATRAAKSKGQQSEHYKAHPVGTGAWPREVGVHRVTWNSGNGLAAAGLLASVTGSGLCRVDELWGRWIKGKVPYGGVEHIRMELEDEESGAMDVDSDDSVASL